MIEGIASVIRQRVFALVAEGHLSPDEGARLLTSYHADKYVQAAYDQAHRWIMLSAIAAAVSAIAATVAVVSR